MSGLRLVQIAAAIEGPYDLIVAVDACGFGYVYSREKGAVAGQIVTVGEGWVPRSMAVLEPEGARHG
jgi:hypothetical protein